MIGLHPEEIGPDGLSPEASLGSQFHNPERSGRRDSVSKEQPWHFQAAQCLALKMSVPETAEFLGKSPKTVYGLLHTPWFQARVQDLMVRANVNLTSLFSGAALAAYATLVEINGNEKVSPAVRVSAAKELLDRHLGKSTQYVEAKTQHIHSDPAARERELLSEVKTLESQMGVALPSPRRGEQWEPGGLSLE